MPTGAHRTTLGLVLLVAGLACGDATAPGETTFAVVENGPTYTAGTTTYLRDGAWVVHAGLRASCHPFALRGVAAHSGGTVVLRAVATVPSPCPSGADAGGGGMGYEWRLRGYGGAEYRVLRVHEVITGGTTRTDTVSDERWRIP